MLVYHGLLYFFSVMCKVNKFWIISLFFYKKLSGRHYQNKASVLGFFILKQGNEVVVLIFNVCKYMFKGKK